MGAMEIPASFGLWRNLAKLELVQLWNLSIPFCGNRHMRFCLTRRNEYGKHCIEKRIALPTSRKRGCNDRPVITNGPEGKEAVLYNYFAVLVTRPLRGMVGAGVLTRIKQLRKVMQCPQ